MTKIKAIIAREKELIENFFKRKDLEILDFPKYVDDTSVSREG